MMIEKNHSVYNNNTDRSDKNGTLWWKFLDLHPRKEIFLFDNFRFEGLKEFIIDDDRKTLNKILFGIKKLKKKTDKVTLVGHLEILHERI